ncbi:MAG: PmoA family protein [Isosphaeraceae bacterium]
MPRFPDRNRLLRACLTIVIAVHLGAWAASAEDWRLIVRQPIDGAPESPVIVPLSAKLPPGTYAFQLPEKNSPVLAQVFEDMGLWLAFVTTVPVAEGTYTLRPAESGRGSEPGGVRFVPSGGNLEIQVNGIPFSEYRTDAGAKPFFFPLLGPAGEPFTRAYPMKDVPGEDRDHPHQRSLWFTHGNVNGVDFWSEQSNHGTVRESSRRLVISGPVAGRLHTTDEWVGPDGKPVCTDERIVTIYRTGSVRVLDFEIALNATAGPVTFGDTKEGMFGLRVASSMDVNKKQGGRIVNAEGLTDEKAWGQPSPWVDYTGPIRGKEVGIAVLNHPRSFRHPTTWHVRTYGLFAANPFGWRDFGVGKSGAYTLPAGESIRFMYRIILHEGGTQTAHIVDQYRRYAARPAIDVARP